MRYLDGELIFSPSDIITFMESEYASWMDRFFLEFADEVTPDEAADQDRIVRAKGEEHESGFLRELLAEGRDVADLSRASNREAAALDAMRAGREIIYQAGLAHGRFAGVADFLVRLEDGSYEAWDTKLARSAKPYFLIQLCCYSEMLAAVQGRLPAEMQVVLGTRERRRFRTEDYFYFYGHLKHAFLERQDAFDRRRPPEIPGPRRLGRWSAHATAILEQRDDLSLVAGIRSTQVRRLRQSGIETVQALAESTVESVRGIGEPALVRLRSQARLQMASRGAEVAAYEVLPPDPQKPRTGLAALPPESPGDVFFDMEGYPLIEDGLEYLFGATYIEGGQPVFRDWWAHNREQEKAALQDFVRWAHARWRSDPAMHIYHYAAYEVAALRRLMGRYGTCEEEVDDLLRNEVFVDLYSIVRQSLVVGDRSYSLKCIEKLYQGGRAGEVATAGDSLVFYHRWLEEKDGEDWTTSAILRDIRDYNREDCESTWKLARWLRKLQARQRVAYEPRPAAASEMVARINERSQYAEAMRAAIPADRGAEGERWRVYELLSWLLEFHRREAKPVFWAMYDRHAMTDQQLIDDPDCLGGLRRTKRPPLPIKRSYGYEYRFDPEQETKLRAGSKCFFAHDLACRTTIESFDPADGLVVIKCSRNAPPDELALIPDEYVSPEPIVRSIERTVARYRETGRLPSAIEDFLYRRPPRLRGRVAGEPVLRPGVDIVEGAIGAAADLDGSTLSMQGPPGSGKTYTAARMIVELLRRGKRVGVTSNGHRAICLLMNEAAAVSAQRGLNVRAAKIGGDEDDHESLHDCIEWIASGTGAFPCDAQLIGGTAWAFSRPEAEGAVDHLFVDEAGQVSVANLLGMAPSAANIVLIGDQMQLSQPVQGSHPGESGTSTLEYLLQGRRTIPPEFGIFLPETWRMHPELCEFISGAVYEDRLGARPVTASRVISFGSGPRRWVHKPAGIQFAPVEHEGNAYESEEEVAAVEEIVAELTSHRRAENGRPDRRLTRDDILVVTPYNLQVRKLSERLPGVRVGTVDKFQGQEAPVVIYSMCASSGDASPRGIEFLFSKNRLNVAVSRARTLAVVVANPALTRTRCASIEQMELVNMFCRAVDASDRPHRAVPVCAI